MKYISLLLLFLAGCTSLGQSTTISANPNPLPDIVNQVLPPDQKAQATLDLQTTASNFDAAAAIGLPTTDLALCAHLINQQLGIEVVAGAPAFPTAQVTNNGLVSEGSIVIIDAMRLAMLKKNGIAIPSNCVMAFGTQGLSALGQIFTGVGGVPINVTPSVTPAALATMVKTAP